MSPSKLPGFDCRYAARALPTALGADRFAPKFCQSDRPCSGPLMMSSVMSRRLVRRAKAEAMRRKRRTQVWDVTASAGRPATWPPLHLDDATALRQNAAVLLCETPLTPIRNLSLNGIGYVNLHFHWDLPKSNICWAK